MSQALDKLLQIMSMLRDPQYGCPWDLEQDFTSIAPHTLEEAYEVVDLIERKEFEHLPNELGDLLFQVVFYAQLGRELGLFAFDDIVAEINAKLLNRHPHVFPDASIESFGSSSRISSGQVEANWEKIKSSEREYKHSPDAEESVSVLEDVPGAFPALVRARKLQKRAATVGFDWTDSGEVFAKLEEELLELKQAVAKQSEEEVAEELGDVLFSVVNLARHLKQEPETSLRYANRKFEGRFRLMEKLIRNDGLVLGEMPLTEMESYWQRAKAAEKSGP